MRFLYYCIIIFLLIISCSTPVWEKRGFDNEEAYQSYLSDSIKFYGKTSLEIAAINDEGFNFFLKTLSEEKEFLGFDGAWYDCNHSSHNYKEFNFSANKIVKLNFNKIDSIKNFNLHYIHKDIRELWGQSTTIKEIRSSGIIKIKDLKEDVKFRLQDRDQKELIYISFRINEFNLPKLEILFDCQSCNSNENVYLYRASEIKKRVVGHRLYLWNSYLN